MTPIRPLTIAACCAFAAWPIVKLCTPRDYGEYVVKDIGKNMSLVLGRGGNSVVFADPEETLVINCKMARHADEFGKLVASLGGGPWRWLVLTDSRPENADAVSALPAGVKVIAHHRTDERLRAEGKRGADLSFDSTLNLRVGGKMVTFQHKGAAQTDGVCYAYFHEQQVLALGDLVANGYHPVLWPEQGGSIRAALRVLNDLRKDYKGTAGSLRLAPGLGEAGGHQLFESMIGYWTAMLDQGNESHRHGQTLAEAKEAADPLRLKYAQWSGDRFARNLEIAYEETKK